MKRNLIEIRCGNFSNSQKLFEEHMFPDKQIEKINTYTNKILSNVIPSHIIIYTNSVYIVESMNKFSKSNNFDIHFYLNNKIIDAEILFSAFSKPFEKLIFDD